MCPAPPSKSSLPYRMPPAHTPNWSENALREREWIATCSLSSALPKKNKIPVPEFFRSEAWKRFNHTILSTSNCGNPSLAAFGFGPVVSPM
mmetsp:Transcript_106411/g.217058  ORF Transcript_106411/g.217058 Transcript_106411/m.217058 type:complete len:91 (-) Transcript_106411:1119-1391(-)